MRQVLYKHIAIDSLSQVVTVQIHITDKGREGKGSRRWEETWERLQNRSVVSYQLY